MITEKLKIVCSVTASRLEFVPVTIADQLQPDYKTEKVSCPVLLNVPKFLSSLCL